MAKVTVTMTAWVAWWLKPYLFVWSIVCEVMGCDPDPEKLEATVLKAIRIKVG